MTDPTPPHHRNPMEHERDTPEPAPDLVERVAQLMANHCGADSVDQWEREFARAVVALVLEDAASLAQDMDLGVGTNPYAWPERISEAIRALIPKGDA